MNIIKLFCFPVDVADKKSEKSPDYRLSAQTAGGFVEVGAGWKGETKERKKYISFTLKETYNGNAGYKLIEDYDARQPVTPTRSAPQDDDWGV